VKEGHPTLDRGLLYRCMLVGFDDGSARICSAAVNPLQPVRVRDATEACAKMSAILPLVVLVAEAASASEGAEPGELGELGELASACGAEVIIIPLPVDGSTLGRRILDALRTSEARRVER
jgi:hypothetical protein